MTCFSGGYVCFVLLRFRLYAFIEAAALRSIMLRYAGAPKPHVFLFSFPLLFTCFYLVTTGWIFWHQLM